MVPPPHTAFTFAFATLRAALAHFLAYASLFIVLGTIAVGRALTVGWLEPFRIGEVEVPKFMGTHASNVAVAVFCAVAVAAVAVGFVVRYFHSRSFLARLRSRGVTDINSDGKTDVFTDKFLDDL
ncbi:MAG: hypothetical protein IT478_00900 [Xanthomonadales bacterium]|nr:hypothetical protein [Xanthomonadales bacterium]